MIIDVPLAEVGLLGPTKAIHFHEDFGGFGNFSGRSPVVGVGPYTAPYSDDLTTIVLDGGGFLPTYTSSAVAAAGTVATFPDTYQFKIRFNPTVAGSLSFPYIDTALRLEASDNWLIEIYIFHDDLGSGFKWYVAPFVGAGDGTPLYSPSPIDIDSLITVGAINEITADVTPGGVQWRVNRTSVATTVLIPDAAPDSVALYSYSPDNLDTEIDWYDSIVTSGFEVSVESATNTIVSVPVGSLVLGSLTPTVNELLIELDSAHLSLTPIQPFVLSPTSTVQVPQSHIFVTGLSPDVILGQNQVVRVPLAHPRLSGINPTVRVVRI